MHEKHKIYGKNFNSNPIIGVKNPIPEHSEINRRPNAEGNTPTIDDLVDDTEPPGKHNKSFANPKLSRQIRYISRSMDEPTNIGYSNKERLYLKKIENYIVIELAENMLCIKISSSSEPKYIIDPDFDIGDEVHNPYAPENIKSPLCTIHYSEETNEFREMVQDDKFLSIDSLN